MNDKEILEFIQNLDHQVSKENAVAKFRSFGEVALYANREGYLRLGIELLKCAYKETYPEADLSYLFGRESEFGIDHLTVDEEQFNFVSS
jgi:hypothetical protein